MSDLFAESVLVWSRALVLQRWNFYDFVWLGHSGSPWLALQKSLKSEAHQFEGHNFSSIQNRHGTTLATSTGSLSVASSPKKGCSGWFQSQKQSIVTFYTHPAPKHVPKGAKINAYKPPPGDDEGWYSIGHQSQICGCLHPHNGCEYPKKKWWFYQNARFKDSLNILRPDEHRLYQKKMLVVS